MTVHSPPRASSSSDGNQPPGREFASAWRRQRLNVEDRTARGRAARLEAPRSLHARWTPAPDRPDPVALLEQQALTRVPELVPIRHGRMLVSPFTFFRGAALIMAADLAGSPRSGVTVQLCGDAHLSNFGLFGTPERKLLFDVNDFDETLPGPWEWDIKRLATSFEVLGRDRGFSAADRRAIVVAGVREYRDRIRRAAGMGGLQAWYEHLEAGALLTMVRKEVAVKRVGKRRGPRPRGDGGQGPIPGQHPRALQARRHRRRRAPDRRRSADHRPGRGPRAAGTPWIDPTPVDQEAARVLPPHAHPAPPPARGVPVRARGPEGRGCRQRGHPLLDRAAGGTRRPRPAVPPGQAGRAVGPRRVPRPERPTGTTGSGSSPGSG